MKVGILSRWNATCGVSLHAEIVGRELLKRGYDIKVFAPYIYSANSWWHHKIIHPDEDFVIRCYEEVQPNGLRGRIYKEALFTEELDFLIVESYEKLPYDDVEEVVRYLRIKGIPSVVVIHEGSHRDLKYSDLNIFERVIIFDNRYFEVLGERVDPERVEIIPYPCLKVPVSKRKFAEDGVIRFFSFGRQPEKEYYPYIEALRKLRKFYKNIEYRIVRSSELLPINEESWIFQEKKILDYDELINEFNKVDIFLLPKGNTNRIVVSSTLYQTIGTLTITVVPDNKFFETLPHGENAPVIFFTDVETLTHNLMEIIENPALREKIRNNAKRFVLENSMERIVDMYEQILNSVFVENVH